MNEQLQLPLVLLVRHALTDLNSEDRIRSIADVDISEAGRRQTLATARQLKPLGIKKIFCSDLSRAEQTAEILANQLFVEVESTRLLRDWDMGELIGEKSEEVRDDVHFYIENPRKRVPGGEPYGEFEKRAGDALRFIVAQSKRFSPIIAVTHSKIIEWIRCKVEGTARDASKLEASKSVDPSGILALKVQNGRITLYEPEKSQGVI
jgi:broad specificity phosphatase PhoE